MIVMHNIRQRALFFTAILVASISLTMTLPISPSKQMAGQEPSVISKDQAMVLATYQKYLLQQLDRLKSIVQFLIQIKNNKELTSSEKAVRQWLFACLREISQLQLLPPYPIYQEQLSLFARHNNKLVQQLIYCIENNLAKIPQISKKTPEIQELSLDVIKDLIDENEHFLEEVTDQAKEAGITPGNRFWRAFDYYVPSLQTISILGITGAVALNLIAKAGKNILGTDKDLVIWNPYNMLPEVNHNIGFSTLTHLGQAAMASFMAYSTYTQASKVIDTFPIAWQRNIKEIFKGLSDKWRQSLEEWKGNDAPFLHATYETISNVTIDDEQLIGIDDQKQVILSIINYLLDPELFIRQGTKIEKGILFTGPSRSGKTELAKRIPGTINKIFAERGIQNRVLFREIKPHELLQEGSLKAVIEDAKQTRQPCIIFIDEFHATGVQTHQDRVKLADALTALEDLHKTNDPYSQIFIIAATNRPDLLDPALLSHKRFGNIVRFKLPTFITRKKFFEIKIKSIAADPDQFDLDLLSHKTERCSYGDLHKVFDAARLATNSTESIKQQHFITAIDRIVHGIIDSIPTELHTKKLVAAHQAGHALAHLLLQPREQLELVTICGINQRIFEVNEWVESKASVRKTSQHDITYGEIFTYHDDENEPAFDKPEILKNIKIDLAGKIAEDIILGSHNLSYHIVDTAHAFGLAKIIILDGFIEQNLSKKETDSLADDAHAMVKQMEAEIRELLMQSKELLTIITQALEERHLLTADNLRLLIQEHQPTSAVAGSDLL